MTLPPEKIGDKGQRYEVRATGWPKKEKSIVGWSNDLEGAERMAGGARKAPGCTSTEIYDRQEQKPIITSYAGILR